LEGFSMADPSYYGTTSDGTDIYVDASSNYVDENGNPVTTTQVQSAQDISNSNSDLAAPVAPVQSPLHTAAPGATANSPGSGGQSTAGMTAMFGAIGSAFASVIAPPKQTSSGSMVYSAATGGYVPLSSAASVGAAGAATNISMWLVIGLVAVAIVIVVVVKK
jgi:hypothetical protein